MGRNGENKNQFVKADERQPRNLIVAMTDLSGFDLGFRRCCSLILLEDLGVSPPFLMRCEATHRVSESSRLNAVLTATRSGRLQGVGQGNKFKPSDMTGGCLALT